MIDWEREQVEDLFFLSENCSYKMYFTATIKRFFGSFTNLVFDDKWLQVAVGAELQEDEELAVLVSRRVGTH